MARDFDGVDQYLNNLNGLSALDNATMSWAYWVNVDATSPPEGIFQAGATNSEPDNHCQMLTHSPVTSGFRIRFQYRFSGSFARWVIDNDLNLSQWYHVAATYDRGGAANDPIIYIDGASVSITEEVAPSGSANTGMDSLVLAAFQPTELFLDCMLADFAHWSRILTADEVKSIANGRHPNEVRRGLEYWWPLWGRNSPEPCYLTRAGLTLNNSPATADHPPLGRYGVGMPVMAQTIFLGTVKRRLLTGREIHPGWLQW